MLSSRSPSSSINQPKLELKSYRRIRRFRICSAIKNKMESCNIFRILNRMATSTYLHENPPAVVREPQLLFDRLEMVAAKKRIKMTLLNDNGGNYIRPGATRIN
jgi:hypothetical protein